MTKRRKCKTCGRSFEPKGVDDMFCSPLCRTAGCFVGGGGDTRKPLSPEQRKALEKKGVNTSSQLPSEPPKRTRKPSIKYPRVLEMFKLPVEKRAEISSKFSPDEAEYARRLAKKQLMDERWFDEEMDCDSDGGGGYWNDINGGSLGDSDDGTI